MKHFPKRNDGTAGWSAERCRHEQRLRLLKHLDGRLLVKRLTATPKTQVPV